MEKDQDVCEKEWSALLPSPNDRKELKISEQESRQHIKTIKAWVQFFGILHIIGIITGIILILSWTK